MWCYTNPMTRAYEEIIDFIAAGTTPREVVAFRPSEEAKARVADLIQREKTTGLSPEETAELNHYLQLEHLMRLAKARARAHLVHEQLH
jgi:phage-related minor tail protein